MKRPEDVSVVAIIPARGGSRRLPRKNVTPIWGRPMLCWAVLACRHSRYVRECYVSTEDAEIAEVAREAGAKVVDRPGYLADASTFKHDVVVHAADSLDQKPDLVVSLQPNSPQVCAHDLDAAIEKLLRFERNEIFTVDENLIQNGAFRAMKYDYVFQKSISTDCGVIVTDYVDVHTSDDVARLERTSRPCRHYGKTVE